MGASARCINSKLQSNHLLAWILASINFKLEQLNHDFFFQLIFRPEFSFVALQKKREKERKKEKINIWFLKSISIENHAASSGGREKKMNKLPLCFEAFSSFTLRLFQAKRQLKCKESALVCCMYKVEVEKWLMSINGVRMIIESVCVWLPVQKKKRGNNFYKPNEKLAK